MALPALQENVCWNGGKLDSGPITRYLATGCGSPWIISFCVSGRVSSPRNWPHAMKNCSSGVKPSMVGAGGLPFCEFLKAR